MGMLSAGFIYVFRMETVTCACISRRVCTRVRGVHPPTCTSTSFPWEKIDKDSYRRITASQLTCPLSDVVYASSLPLVLCFNYLCQRSNVCYEASQYSSASPLVEMNSSFQNDKSLTHIQILPNNTLGLLISRRKLLSGIITHYLYYLSTDIPVNTSCFLLFGPCISPSLKQYLWRKHCKIVIYHFEMVVLSL